MAVFVKDVDRQEAGYRDFFAAADFRADIFVGAILSKTRSKASTPSGPSSAPISRAMSMKRFDSAGSSCDGLGLRGMGALYTHAAYSSNRGNES